MNSVPLTDVLPWGDEPPSGGRTVLVLDSAETNGRFLLHTIAAQCLSSKSKSFKSRPSRGGIISTSSSSSSPSSTWYVLWISCGTTTEEQIRAAMKKIGCDLRSNADRVEIIPIICQLAQQCASELDNDNAVPPPPVPMDEEECMKNIYKKIRDVMSTIPKCVILLDDATSLSTFFGCALTHAFLQKIQTLVRKQARRKQNFDASFVMVASHDMDQELYIHSTNQQEQTSVTGGKRSQHIGAEQMMTMTAEIHANRLMDDSEDYVWERTLVELADGVVDVTPLASGFARDVHGRLVFTELAGSGGLGWKERTDIHSNSKVLSGRVPVRAAFSTSIVNYCCSDAGVRAIRLRVGS